MFLPAEKPVLSQGKIEQFADVQLKTWVPKCKLVGIRGFFSPQGNQRAEYDDAIFLLTPNVFMGFNANVDPGAFADHIATLQDGVWHYQLGIHGLSKPKEEQYEALVQAGPVTVKRDGGGLDTGMFGINIHHGGYSKVSSLGCQTIPPNQWPSFIATVKAQLEQFGQQVIPYILTDEKIV